MREYVKENIVEILKRFGREGDEVANWLSAFSRVVRRYILPYMEELGEKVDDNYLTEIIEKTNTFYPRDSSPLYERPGYVFWKFSQDLFKLLDIFLRAADEEYRSLRAGDKLGENLLLVESELRINIYRQDSRYRLRQKSEMYEILNIPKDQISYLILGTCPWVSVEKLNSIEDFLEQWNKTIIVVGYQDRIDPQLENLFAFCGCRYIQRIITDSNNNNIVMAFAKRIKENAKS